MAILERPATTPELVPGEQSRRSVDPGARPKTLPKRRGTDKLPIAALAIVACVSVGYGMGTLVQFDHDWRGKAPVSVASASGEVAVGTPLAEAIDDLLADSTTPVADVQCDPTAYVETWTDGQLCRARADSGMVSIVATGSASQLHVEVFSSN